MTGPRKDDRTTLELLGSIATNLTGMFFALYFILSEFFDGRGVETVTTLTFISIAINLIFAVIFMLTQWRKERP